MNFAGAICSGSQGFPRFCAEKTWIFLYLVKIKPPYIRANNNKKGSDLLVFYMFFYFAQYAGNIPFIKQSQNHIIRLLKSLYKALLHLRKLNLFKIIYQSINDCIGILAHSIVFRQHPNEMSRSSQH